MELSVCCARYVSCLQHRWLKTSASRLFWRLISWNSYSTLLNQYILSKCSILMYSLYQTDNLSFIYTYISLEVSKPSLQWIWYTNVMKFWNAKYLASAKTSHTIKKRDIMFLHDVARVSNEYQLIYDVHWINEFMIFLENIRKTCVCPCSERNNFTDRRPTYWPCNISCSDCPPNGYWLHFQYPEVSGCTMAVILKWYKWSPQIKCLMKLVG